MNIPKGILTPGALSWVKTFIFVLTISASVVIGTVKVITFLDDRFGEYARNNADRFYERNKGVVLEEKVTKLEAGQTRLEQKIDVIQRQQTDSTNKILLEIGRLGGMLESHK